MQLFRDRCWSADCTGLISLVLNHLAVALCSTVCPHHTFLTLTGINITAFTTAMLEQRRLDTRLYEAIVKHMPAGELPEDEGMPVEAGVTAFNSVYGELCTRNWADGEGDVVRFSPNPPHKLASLTRLQPHLPTCCRRRVCGIFPILARI